MRGISGKTALVTGGASGIGAATVHAFLEAGARVVAVDLSRENLDQLERDAESHSAALTTIQADLSSANGAVAAARQALSEAGTVDILVNIAGMHDAGISLLDTPDQQWEKTFAVNVSAHFWLAKELIPGMIEQGGGAVVTISSAAGVVGGGGGPAYTASKHAAVGLTKALAVEFGPQGVRCNTITPGVIVTPMLDALPEEVKGGFGAVAEGTAARRLGEPAEIASAVLFLASDEASFMYGATVAVDGGFTTI